MLAPMMPHLAEECWKALGHRASSRRPPGRRSSRRCLQVDTVLLPVQVNGKKRAELTIAAGAATLRWRGRRWRSSRCSASSKAAARVVVVPNRIVNVVA